MDKKQWLEDANWLNANIELNSAFGRKHLSTILEICKFKYKDDLAEEALSCIIANLISNHYANTPTIIPGSKDYWKGLKESCGIQWATPARVKDIMKILGELGYVDNVGGFQNKIKSAMARYWLKNDCPMIQTALNFKGSIIYFRENDGPSFTVRDMEGGTMDWSKLKHSEKLIDRMDKGVKRYNRFTAKQDIGFSITLDEITNKDVNIVNALINMMPEVNTNKITLMMNNSRVVRIRSVAHSDGSIDSNRRKVIVETVENSYTVCYLEVLSSSVQCNKSFSYIELAGFDSTKYRLTNDINGFGLFILGHFTLSGSINYTAQSRIFNRESFSMGGRFYGGPWNNMNKVIRKKFIINEEPVARVDYVGIHIKLLYHLKNKTQFNKECYVYDKVDNNEDRTRMKFIALIIINAKNRREGVYAINQKLKSLGLYQSNYKTNKLIDIFFEYHKAISNYFFKDCGVELQRYDSTIMYNVLKKLTKMRIPAISVHDEVIAPVKFKDVVKKVMLNEYKKEMKFETNVS